jgi:hypothetical protein
MQKIFLTKNRITLVDDEDYDHLNQFKWHFDGNYATRLKQKNYRLGGGGLL